jgi:hypothetical protein
LPCFPLLCLALPCSAFLLLWFALLWFYPFNVDLGALYGPSIFHMPSASVHRTVMSIFKATTNLKPFRPGWQLEFKPPLLWRVEILRMSKNSEVIMQNGRSVLFLGCWFVKWIESNAVGLTLINKFAAKGDHWPQLYSSTVRDIRGEHCEKTLGLF